MSEQNRTANSSPLSILPAKRRRGRPRKDWTVAEKVSSQSPAVIPTPETKKIVQPVEVKEKDSDVEDMLGRMVSGVIDGCFDAGYFLTVRVGNSSTLLRGVVFQPGRFSPITAATDVVPQAKMFQRREVPIPVLNLQGQDDGIIPQLDKLVNQPVQQGTQPPVASEQVLHPKPTVSASLVVKNQVNQPTSVTVPQSGSLSVSVPVSNMSRSDSGSSLGGKMMAPLNLYQKLQSQSAPPPLENLRMVEQDEVMQVFEISAQPQWSSKVNAKAVNVSCSEETGNQVSQTHSQTLGSTEPCFTVCDLDLSNARLPKNPVASESQAVESKMEKNKSPNSEERHPNHDQQTAVAAQPQYVQQEPPVMDSEPLVRAEDKSISQEPQSESELYKPSDPVHSNEQKAPSLYQHQDQNENHQTLEAQNKNTNFEFHQNLAAGNTQALPPELFNGPMDFMIENPTSPNNDTSKDSLKGNPIGYPAENA